MRLFWLGMWWRRWLLAALLGVAVVTTTGAALGPIYARASAESILQDHLTKATWRAGLHMRTTLDLGKPDAYARFAHRVVAPGAIRGYDTARAGFYTPVPVEVAPARDAGNLKTHLVWVDGQCPHLVILRGRCPQRPNEALISQRGATVAFDGLRLGARLYLGAIPNPNANNYSSFGTTLPVPPPVRIVGVYRPRSTGDPFWFGQDYFDQHVVVAGQAEDTIDSLIVAKSEFTTRPKHTVVEANFYYPLTPAELRLDDVAGERRAVAHLLAADDLPTGFSVDSGLLPVLHAAAQEKHLVDVATLLVTVQLTLLAWLVLFQVAADAIAARGNEIAMARLRGHSLAATLRFGLAEPVLVLAAAVPIGVGLAVAVTHAFADNTFVPGVPVELTWAPVLTALLAFAGGLSAALAGGYRTLTRSVLDQWRGTTRRPGHGRWVLALDLALAAAAVVGLVALLTDRQAGEENDTAALLTPGLLVFAVAIIGVRGLPLACRWVARGTRLSRRVGTFLASRQVARRPAGLRLAAFLAVAAGLATFAVAGESVAGTNRTRRAQAEIGAPRVATVQFAPGTDPVTATHRADPDGKWAMAAATWLPDGGGSVVGTVLGVDAPRLAATAYPGTVTSSVPALAGALAPPVPPLVITGRQMRVDLTAGNLTGNVAPVVQLNLRTPDQPARNAEGGAIRDGAHAYVVPVPCARGCVLRGITWDRPVTAEGRLAGTITVTGLHVREGDRWQPLDLGLTVAKSWYAATALGQAEDHVTLGPAGVRDRFANVNGGYGGIAYSSDPSPMPAIATPNGIGGPAAATGRGQLIDASNTTAAFRVVRTEPILPAVVGRGLIMNLQTLQDEQPAFTAEANWQVWLGPNAPPDALKRLAAAGLQVSGVVSANARNDELAREAPALALLLLLVCAIAGAVLAAGGTATSITAGGRRRSYELAALRVVGVPRRSLLRASVIEQLLLLGSAVVLGVPTGLLAARLAMPAIPEFATRTPVSLDYAPPFLPTAVFVFAFALLLVATAVGAGFALIRAAVPSRLRAVE